MKRSMSYFSGYGAAPGVILLTSAVVVILLTTFQQTAQAVPSFSRQTGQPCSACHYTPPELNAAGREFKLLGYTQKAEETATVESKPNKRSGGLDLLKSLPLSAFINVGFTSTKSAVPGTQDGTLQLPQGVSLFLAGAWSEHMGSWIEFHYSPSEDHFGLEAADVRYARRRKLSDRDLIYGITVNNAPTLEDPWNSTPRWSFPFQSSGVPPKPLAAAIVNGPLEADVAGPGGYAIWNNHLYADATIYRTVHPAVDVPFTGGNAKYNIHGVAPYWRVAWQQVTTYNDFEIGTYGMHMTSTPFSFAGAQDAYTDVAGDFQFNRTIPQWGRDVISFRGTYIRQNSSLNGLFAAGKAALIDHHLDTTKVNVEYHFGNRVSAGVGWLNVTGTPDRLLYSSAPVKGSANGDPRTSGYV